MTDFTEPQLFTPNQIVHNTPPKPTLKLAKIVGLFLLVSFVVCVVTFIKVRSLNEPPLDFPIDQPIQIAPGTSAKEVAAILQQEHVIKSSTLLYYAIVFFYDPTALKASTYVFDKPYQTLEIAKRLTEGDFDTNLIRFTHFEGERASQIAAHAASTLPNFNNERFLQKAVPFEGKLFPDTYFIPDTYTDEDLLTLLLTTFTQRTAELQPEIASSTLSLDEILILASIIEREANSPESMKLVSSVLQNRLHIGMALQADASIEYILDKPLAELTPEDLEIDSPYNTYRYTGLPPTPIGNPGLDAIIAVLEPTASDYFYYITDNEGQFHFAKTYSEHLRNIETYLR